MTATSQVKELLWHETLPKAAGDEVYCSCGHSTFEHADDLDQINMACRTCGCIEFLF